MTLVSLSPRIFQDRGPTDKQNIAIEGTGTDCWNFSSFFSPLYTEIAEKVRAFAEKQIWARTTTPIFAFPVRWSFRWNFEFPVTQTHSLQQQQAVLTESNTRQSESSTPRFTFTSRGRSQTPLIRLPVRPFFYPRQLTVSPDPSLVITRFWKHRVDAAPPRASTMQTTVTRETGSRSPILIF